MKPKTKFTFNNLVSGMIVQFRNGQLARVFVNYRDTFTGFLAFRPIDKTRYGKQYDNNLKSKSYTDRTRQAEWDIVKVYQTRSLKALWYNELSRYDLVAEINRIKPIYDLSQVHGDDLITEIAKRGLKIEVTKDEIEVKTIK